MTMLAIEAEPVDQRWARITAHAPVLAATCRHYLDQIAVSVRPNTVNSADIALRLFASWLIDHDPTTTSLGSVNRGHIEAYKLWLANRENTYGEKLKKTTISLRLGMLRVIIERLIEWDHPDAPLRNPIFGTDLPKLDEPLPKFLDDDAAAAFMHAATRLDPFRRLVVEMLARTGMRVGELCALQADAVVTVGETQWLRVPVGKLHTDRYIPLHPILLELLDQLAGMGRTRRQRPADHQPEVDPSTAAASPASSPAAPASPASATSTLTGCATLWRPKRSTEA